MPESLAIARVQQALDELRRGRMILLADDEDRENEGDLVVAAEHVTPEAINFMARNARGLICLALTAERVEQLGLPMMVQDNQSRFSTAFTVSIEAARGVTTGISAADRAATVRAALAPGAEPGDLVRPGHVFPLRARPGGVLVRTGQTEGSVDLARLAGLAPAAVICEVMNDDGTMARRPQLQAFAARHGLLLLSVADVVRYRMERERLVRRAAEALLPTRHGQLRAIAYENDVDQRQHVAVVLGSWARDEAVPVRVHARCLPGDVFGSTRCGCGRELERALEMMSAAGKGVLVYLDQESPGKGLANKLRAYNLQDAGGAGASGEPGYKPDLRDYGIGAQILRDLGVRRMRLLTNNPKKMVALGAFDLEIVEEVPLDLPARAADAGALRLAR